MHGARASSIPWRLRHLDEVKLALRWSAEEVSRVAPIACEHAAVKTPESHRRRELRRLRVCKHLQEDCIFKTPDSLEELISRFARMACKHGEGKIA